jgi:hypothetical protein
MSISQGLEWIGEERKDFFAANDPKNIIMEDEKITPQDSIRIIQAMIDSAKNTVADKSFYFLLWGWLVFVGCVAQYILKVVFLYPYHPLVWTIVLVGFVISTWRGAKERKVQRVRSYVDANLDYLWIGIVGAYILVDFTFARIGWRNCFTFYMLLYALGTFVTGMAIKFRPLVWGAVSCWIMAFISLYLSFDLNILLSALAILVSYIIPGYLLQKKFKKSMVGVLT